MDASCNREKYRVYFKLSHGRADCGRWGHRPRRTQPRLVSQLEMHLKYWIFLFNGIGYHYFLKKVGGYLYLFLKALLKVLQFL